MHEQQREVQAPPQQAVEAKNCLSRDRGKEGVQNACWFLLITNVSLRTDRRKAILLSFHSFRNDLFQRERFLAVRTLGFTLACDDQQPTALWTGLLQRALPGSEVTGWIILTAVEGAPFTRLARDQFAAILRAVHADLFQPGFGVTAGGEIRARDKLPKTPVADDQLAPIFRALASDRLRLALHHRHLRLRLFQVFCER